MLACIPTNTGAGVEDSLCDHFGSAAYFTLYDTEHDTVTVVANGNAHHSHGTCHPVATLAGYGINSIICRGMGRRAVEMMNAQGITIYRTRVESVRDAIAQIKSGALKELDPKQACAGHAGRQTYGPHSDGCGHGEGQGFGPGHEHGQGQGRGGGRGGGQGRGC